MVKGVYNFITLRTLQIVHEDQRSYPVEEVKNLLIVDCVLFIIVQRQSKKSDRICNFLYSGS